MPFAQQQPENPRRPLTRSATTTRRVTLLELFFDLVYVVALALISRGLAEEINWHQAGQALILLAAVWWTWTITSLVTDLYDPERTEIKALVLAVMFGVLLMASAIPKAFGDRGLTFAGAYVAIHLGRGLFIIPAVRNDRQIQRRAARVFCWFTLSAVPWIGGAFVSENARMALWLLALGLDYLGLRLSYPVPGLGSVPASLFRLTAEHLAERYQQFYTIALGDAILVIGMAYTTNHSELEDAVALLLAFATTLVLWRIYVHKAGELLPVAIKVAKKPIRFLGTSPYTHLVMVAGVVITAAGFEVVLHTPTLPARTPPEWAAIMLGGPALFLVGRALFEREVFNRVSWSRPGGVVALTAVAPATLFLPSLTAGLAALLVLTGVALADLRHTRTRPPEAPMPP
ncbi:low temperature requirement protein A [Verrucosispora sp. WMMD1129]|uniref:low temperature requirement protein A n=1 Tax=Verrucosispora sp. WMMD1129 TaxID=3016093 RepID=UPI00249AD729|nr:low temperature requirement protein A [Verrucosispora sp. WMMD1129]WFE43438.1 low temperature requirement protein A [Verrucosispora sp. WMMD1129]